MKEIKDYISELIELRKENVIDPFNFSLLKFASWETSLRARIEDHTDNIVPKMIEIIAAVIDENVDKEDSEKIAKLQVELTKKYGDKLLNMDKEINERIENYIELYQKALQRIMEDEAEDENYETN